MTMPSRSAKRKREDFERTFNDDSGEVSESGTSSGISFQLSDSGEHTDSSADYMDLVKSARKGARKSCTTRKVVKPKAGVKRSDTQEKFNKGSKVVGTSKLQNVSTKKFESQEEAGNSKRRKIDIESNSSVEKLEENANHQLKGTTCAAERQGKEESSEIESIDLVNGRGANSMKRSTKCGNVKLKERMTEQDLNPETSSLKGLRKLPKTATNVNQKSKGTKWYDKKVIEQVCNRLREGDTVKTLANEFNIKEGTIKYWRSRHIPEEEQKEMMKKFGIIRYDEQFIEQVQKHLREGTSTETIARTFGVEKKTVNKWRKKFAPETLRPIQYGLHYDKTVVEACKQLKNGVSTKKIALKMGVHPTTVRNWKRKYLKKYQESTEEGNWEYDGCRKLDVCNRLKQGETIETIAKVLDIPIYVLLKWKEESAVTIVLAPETGDGYEKQIKLNVCKRLQQGESAPSIARKLGISSQVIYAWRNKYCRSELPKPSGGFKYGKETTIRGCELLKSGKKVTDVARELRISEKIVSSWKSKYFKRESKSKKLNTFSTVLHLTRNCHCRKLVLEAYRLLKQGDSLTSTARKLEVHLSLVYTWSRRYFLIKETTEDDLKLTQQLREHFTVGDTTKRISKKFDSHDWIIDKWRYKYLEEISSRFQERVKMTGKSIDAKLKSTPIVLLQEDLKVDKLCRMHDVHPYCKPGKPIEEKLVKQSLNRLKDGVSSKIIAKELGVLEQRVERWKMKYIPKKPAMKNGRKRSEYCEVSQEAVAFMKQGVTSKLLAKRYGVKESTIHSWRKKYAAETMPATFIPNKDTVFKVCRELKKGSTVVDVVQKMGLTFAKVQLWQARYVTRRLQETTSEGSWEYDRHTKFEAWEQIQQTVAAEIIARNLGVNINLVRKWEIDYAEVKRMKRMRLKKLVVSDGKGHSSTLNQHERNKRRVAKVFIPLRKVYIPNRMKLKFVKMIEDGVPLEKVSNELNVHELTIKSWILNRNLLENAAREMPCHWNRS